MKPVVTSQPIDGPLLELLKFDLGGRGFLVETQSVRVVLLLVLRDRELLFFMIVNVSSS